MKRKNFVCLKPPFLKYGFQDSFNGIDRHLLGTVPEGTSKDDGLPVRDLKMITPSKKHIGNRSTGAHAGAKGERIMSTYDEIREMVSKDEELEIIRGIKREILFLRELFAPFLTACDRSQRDHMF